GLNGPPSPSLISHRYSVVIRWRTHSCVPGCPRGRALMPTPAPDRLSVPHQGVETSLTSTITAEIAPGPASIGTPSGMIPKSSFSAPASASPGASLVWERRARRPADVLALVVRRGMRLTLLGVVIGVVAAPAVTGLPRACWCM